LELGEFIAAPYAGRLLADAGAAVIKVELPDGDPSRRYGPFPGGRADHERSGLYAYLNCNKRGITIDIGDGESLQALRRLLADTDIALMDRAFIERLPDDFAPERLANAFPRLVVTSVTPFGRSGPYRDLRAYDITISAAAGNSVGIGEPSRPPLPLPISQCEFQGGLTAAIASLMALLGRDTSGRGQHVDLSIHDVMSVLHTGYYLPRYIFGGGVVGLRSGRTGSNTPYPNTVLPCRDGLVELGAPQVEQWKRFVALMGTPEWSKEPRYRNRRAMQWQYKAEVDALVTPWLMEHSKEELIELFVRHRIPFAPLLTAAELIDNPHLRARDAITEYEMAGGGRCKGPAAPLRFGGAAGHPMRAPRLGEHNDLLKQPQQSEMRGVDDALPNSTVATASRRERPRPPLAGYRILDLGTAWAGGMAGRVLADFGADVIKVESWTHMDGSRKGKPILVNDTEGGDEGKWPDMQPGFHVMARNKRSIAINLRTPGGLSLVKRLVRISDAVLHNFSPGVLERLGLDYETLRRENERIVVVGQSIAGSNGPLRDYIGYATTVTALSGLGNLIGYEGEEPIGMFEGLFSDVVSALTTAYAALVGLAGSRHGRGCHYDLSQWEATSALIPELLLEYTITGRTLSSQGFVSRLRCPNGTYPCAGEEEWLSITTGSDEEWSALCAAIGQPSLAADRRFSTLETRQRNRASLDELLSAWTRLHHGREAMEVLQAAGVAAFPVQNIEGVYFDEHLGARGVFEDVEHPLVGSEPLPGIPWKLTSTPGAITRPAPLLGEHNADILMGLLELSPGEYQALVDCGAIETGPLAPQRVSAE